MITERSCRLLSTTSTLRRIQYSCFCFIPRPAAYDKIKSNGTGSSNPARESSNESLTDFQVIKVEPLTKNQAIQLVDKLKYDPDVKEKFIKH